MTNTLPPAHWAADPSGRHEHRYWDGTRWTDHVSDQGAVTVDPIDGSTPQQPAPAAVAEPLPVNADGLLMPMVEAPSPPPPAAGTAYLPTTTADSLGLAKPDYWRGLDGLRTALVVLLGLSAVVSVMVVVAISTRLGVISDIEQGRFSASLPQRAQDADDFVSASVAIALLLYVATGVVFIVWQWRSAKNLEALGRTGAPRGPGWSIAGWLVPFVNFVFPVLIVQDLWRGTTAGTGPGDGWRKERSSGLVWCWWALFLVGTGIGRFVNTDDSTTLSDLRQSNNTLLGGYVIMAIAAVLAIVVVVQLTRRFDARRAEALAQ
ncbi:MAG TPA: DUF4328 domain-containing protein [Acidimicrobiia bacterium]|nr:DUF4328 domain-containing protein [Acidimicrobiia bacterium]